jgi:hypothetical protein
MKLLDEAKKLADDIREYAPNTNIEFVIRELIKEVEFLQQRVNQISLVRRKDEKIIAVKGKAKVKAS